jgi:predicted nucleotidyltransferase
MTLATPTIAADTPLLRDVVERILTVKRPAAIILFGSLARGDAHDGSDLDLLIVEHENPLPRHRRATPYQMAFLGINRDIDLLIYTPEEIEEWANVPQAFITTVMREGRVLYEDGNGPGARLVR